MAEDYYKTLGVARDASPADIQKAYRDLARKYHPDLNPDDRKAKSKFQEVQRAFDVLNDPGKRELYDRYGSSFESRTTGGGGPRPGGRTTGSEDFDFEQFFGERFGGDPTGGFGDLFNQFRRAGGAKSGSRRAPKRGEDLYAEVQIPFNVAVQGGHTQLALTRPEGQSETLSVKIPAGIADGQKIRLRGQGAPAARGQPGDLIVTVRVAPHPHFTRRGNHLDITVPVTLAEAVLGAKIDVPTPQGTISLRVPPGTSGGTKLRAKGRGVAMADGTSGDLYAEIQIVLPKDIPPEAAELIRQFDASAGSQPSPRGDLRW